MDNPPREYVFWTDCISSVGSLINEMREEPVDVTYETMLKHCDILSWAEDHGYERASNIGHGLTLKNDWSVSYYKSHYCGFPCYYLVWSAIEFVWVPKKYTNEIANREEWARSHEAPRTSLLASDNPKMISEDGLDYFIKQYRLHPNRLLGGRADKRDPLDFDRRQLRIGIVVEREHTENDLIALEIAMDHLAEIPDYYTRLSTIDPHDNPDTDSDIIVPDSSWDDPDELWGRLLEVGDPACIQRNPPYAWKPLIAFSKNRVMEARSILQSYGIKLSSNLKTLICLSMTRNLSCLMTEWCQKFCYGKGQNFCRPKAVNLLLNNFDGFQFMATASRQIVNDVAYAIITICEAFGIKNIRITGVGDYTIGLIRVAASIAEQDSTFTVWGFTRKHGLVLNEMPVRDNIVIWASIDASMSDKRINQAIDFSNAHRTGLAYSTELGRAYVPRKGGNEGLDTQPPWFHPVPHVKQHNFRPDEFLNEFLINSDLHAVFGYHGRGFTTHVGREYPECPATDPLGGAHFVGACQECYWCIEKPHNQYYTNLIEHRLNNVVTIPIGKYQGTKVLLDTGERI